MTKKNSAVAYRSPSITLMGDVVALTKGTATPVSDNGHNPDDGYQDSANDPTGPGGPRADHLLNVDDLDA